jgi:hypothetical protein
VRGQLRIRVTAMAWMARLSARPPPRLSRCRMVWPLLAGVGLVPPRAANAASVRRRPGWEKLTMACAALAGPMPNRLVRPGDGVDDGQQPGMAAGELVPGLVQRGREAADPGLAGGLLAPGIGGQLAPGQGGQGPLGEGVAGGPAVGVVPG